MSESKHTPGPWRVGVTSDAGEVDVIAEGGWFVAVACDSAGDGDTEANANLIAAAPDMLEALEKLVSRIDETRGPTADTALAAARAAIKKARGEK